MEAKICVGHFNTLLFWDDIYCQHLEEFSEGSGRTISAAALLSPVSGKVYINSDKHPENISVPILCSRPRLHKRGEEVPGNGKSWFLTLATESLSWWENWRGNVTMAMWAGSIIVSKRPSWLVESGTPWGGMQPPWAPHATQCVFRMDFALSSSSDQNSEWPKQDFAEAKGGKKPGSACSVCFPVFFKCHAVLTKALSSFQNDFHLSWVG